MAAKRAAEEAEAQLAEARAAAAGAVSAQSQLQVKLTLAERRVEALEGEKRVLQADRDFTMVMLEERQESQAALSQASQAVQSAKQDVEQQLAAACKDNAVLLQRLKETAGEADEMAARRAAVEARAEVRDGGKGLNVWCYGREDYHDSFFKLCMPLTRVGTGGGTGRSQAAGDGAGGGGRGRGGGAGGTQGGGGGQGQFVCSN